jgi:TrmH family RNA methyltransferase
VSSARREGDHGREPIRSLQNQRVKQAVKLRERREREKTGLTLVDGARELLRAVDGGVQIQELFVCEERVRTDEARAAVAAATPRAGIVQPVSPAVLEKLTFGDRDEGMLGVVRWAPRTLEQLAALLPANPLLLVVEGVEKPGNLGALLRTADAAGVSGVIVCDALTDLTNPNAVRASLGTIFTLPVATSDAASASACLVARGIRSWAVTPEAATVYSEAALRGPTALIVGTEHAGLSQAWRGGQANSLRIPMAGYADSLNVAAAAAIVLFEAVRQRGLD